MLSYLMMSCTTSDFCQDEIWAGRGKTFANTELRFCKV